MPKIEEITTKDQLEMLYSSSALTAEGLIADNAYQSDLPIICIPLDEIGNPSAISVPALLMGFRWFDDVANNNLLNEKEQSESARASS